MFKRIRDFIYDINDIFVAIIILALAAGVIYWRSANIVDYPKYLSEKNNTNASSEIDFSGIDLDPEPVDTDFNYNPENQGSLVDPENPPASNTVDPSDVPVPGGENTANNTNNSNNTENSNSAENTNSADNGNNNTNSSENENSGENTGDDSIDFVVPYGTSWFAVADELSRLGLIEDSDTARMNFVYTAANMGLDTMLYPDTYQLYEGMSYEEIIRVLCRVD